MNWRKFIAFYDCKLIVPLSLVLETIVTFNNEENCSARSLSRTDGSPFSCFWELYQVTWSTKRLMLANCTLFQAGLDVVAFFSAVCATLFSFYSHASKILQIFKAIFFLEKLGESFNRSVICCAKK